MVDAWPSSVNHGRPAVASPLEHPRGRSDSVRDDLTHLAVRRPVSADTQHQALSVLLLLCRQVVGLDVDGVAHVGPHRRPWRQGRQGPLDAPGQNGPPATPRTSPPARVRRPESGQGRRGKGEDFRRTSSSASSLARSSSSIGICIALMLANIPHHVWGRQCGRIRWWPSTDPRRPRRCAVRPDRFPASLRRAARAAPARAVETRPGSGQGQKNRGSRAWLHRRSCSSSHALRWSPPP